MMPIIVPHEIYDGAEAFTFHLLADSTSRRPRHLGWVAPIVCAAIILGLGTPPFSMARTGVWFEPVLQRIWPGASYGNIYLWHELIRWTAHFTEYSVLFLILSFGPLRGRPIMAFAACVALASLDETLQTLTPARSGMLSDVGLDSSGAATMLAVAMPYWDWLRQRRSRRRIGRTADGTTAV